MTGTDGERGAPMDRRTRLLFLVGSLAALAGSGTNLVALFLEIRWLAIPALVLWIAGGLTVLVAAGRYVSGRRSG
jgi:hypothetical protein